jgi:hypothetical protein
MGCRHLSAPGFDIEIGSKRRREMLSEYREAEARRELERMRREIERPKRFIDGKSRAAGEREDD